MLEIGGSAITAALVAAVIALTKVVEYFMNKKKAAVEVEANSFREQQQEELHQCFLYLTEHKVQMEYLRNDIKTIVDSQHSINTRISELITSQQRVVDRIGDLINSMDKLLRRD
jgi:formiminotetrahydrofolate cyclodeaminase